MDTIFHIAQSSAWAEAQASGQYRVSSLGRTLEEEGFIHCSREEQVTKVANTFYPGMTDLVLLVIDAARVRAPITYENADDRGQPFPHIYGPLDVDAVVQARPLSPRPDGSFG